MIVDGWAVGLSSLMAVDWLHSVWSMDNWLDRYDSISEFPHVGHKNATDAQAGTAAMEAITSVLEGPLCWSVHVFFCSP